MKKQQWKEAFLEKNVFKGLKNRNDGFDAGSIRYFSATDFRIVLERVEKCGLGIYGIEPWKNRTFFDVYSHVDYSKKPTDPEWYHAALRDFMATGEELLYAASYYVPPFDHLP